MRSFVWLIFASLAPSRGSFQTQLTTPEQSPAQPQGLCWPHTLAGHQAPQRRAQPPAQSRTAARAPGTCFLVGRSDAWRGWGRSRTGQQTGPVPVLGSWPLGERRWGPFSPREGDASGDTAHTTAPTRAGRPGLTCEVGRAHACVVVDAVHAGGVVLAVVVLTVVRIDLTALPLEAQRAGAALGMWVEGRGMRARRGRWWGAEGRRKYSQVPPQGRGPGLHSGPRGSGGRAGRALGTPGSF